MGAADSRSARTQPASRFSHAVLQIASPASSTHPRDIPREPSLLNLTTLRIIFGLPLALLFVDRAALAQVGTPYCFGTSCPCSNDDLAAGCGNSGIDGDSGTGALLSHAAGSTNVHADDLVLLVQGLAQGQNGLIYMGQNSIQAPFGDGQRCVGAGPLGLKRFPIQPAGSSGSFSVSGLVAHSQNFGPGAIIVGSTWNFQGWYRDPAGPCGSAFNLTNALPVTFTSGPIETELAGEDLGEFPHFDFVRAFNRDAGVQATIDPILHPSIMGITADVYVVDARTRAEWDANTTLIDARGAATQANFSGLDVAANSFLVDNFPSLTPAGTDLAVPFDLVIDVNMDGQLSDGDFIDGRGDENGFSVYKNIILNGPYSVVETTHNHGGSFHTQNIYYPSNIASIGPIPLIVVSHGNGHNYQWYDHIGYHMASHGYVVMSHQNNTVPGPNAASITTIDNTELFFLNLANIDAGALSGHVDADTIVWLGHSRGGEGVARAYDRLVDGTNSPSTYTKEDIKLVSSIAPTDFLGTNSANPHDVPYHLWTGSADADVNGGPTTDIVQTYHLLDRATGIRMGVTYQGAGHGAFHDGGGSTVATGPCQVGRVKVHKLMKGLFLPMVRHIVQGDRDAKDFIWRNFESLHPIGAPLTQPECIIVNSEYWEGPDSGKFVIDDFQSEPAVTTSSSGALVQGTISGLAEGRYDDPNSSFAWTGGDAMNGMTRAGVGDNESGNVFDWTIPSWIEFHVPSA
ncbi:MAG: hypothetical protein ACI841_005320, partial [Planctomycetota bacterium]